MPQSSQASPAAKQGWQDFAGKYREVILSILLFIVLDLGVLVLNYIISFQIQGDAMAVNLSGRQRMLSQRTTKTLYQLQSALANGTDQAPVLSELKTAYELFDSTLIAFEAGGAATGGDGKPVQLPAVTDAKARQPVLDALPLWAELRGKIQAVLSESPKPAESTVAAAVDSAKQHNLTLLKLMNNLTSELERIAQNKGAMLRTVQTVAIVLVLLNFAVIMIHIIGKLRRSDAEVAQHASDLELANLRMVETNEQLENTNSALGESNSQLEYAIQQLEYSNAQLEYTNAQLADTNAQLENTTAALAVAKQETDTIFSTVRQGLFLIGPDAVIGGQCSEELKAMFQTEEFAERNFLHLLRSLIPEKKYSTVVDYCALLFDPRKNEKQLVRFNPLKRVELNFPSPEGGFLTKHMEFTFQRVISNGVVGRVLVTAMDVTERVQLEAQIKAGEEKRQRQFELLFELLQIESEKLRHFMDEATSMLERINGIFMDSAARQGRVETVQEKVQKVFRLAHNLKSHAASAGLNLFEKSVHQIEEKLHELRKDPDATNEDLLPVLVGLSNFQSDLDEAAELIEKVSNLRRTFTRELHGSNGTNGTNGAHGTNGSNGNGHNGSAVLTSHSATSELQRSVEELAQTIQQRLGKKARIDWKIHDFDRLPEGHRRALHNAALQLVRNSLAHGIEMPEQRKAAGKDPCGCLTIELRRDEDGRYLLKCRDDGAGLDAKGIRERVVNEGLLGKTEAASLPDDELWTFIFEPGFSTASSVSHDAGRGVGLDALRTEIIDELDGEIRVEFAKGHFCEFDLMLPAA